MAGRIIPPQIYTHTHTHTHTHINIYTYICTHLCIDVYYFSDRQCSCVLLLHTLKNGPLLRRLLQNLLEQIPPLHQRGHGAPRNAVAAPGTSRGAVDEGAFRLPEEIGAELGVVAVVLGAAAAEPAQVAIEAGLVGAGLWLPAAGLEGEVGVQEVGAGLHGVGDVVPEGGGELGAVRVGGGAVRGAGRVQQLPLRADGRVLESRGRQVGGVGLDVEHGPRDRVDAVDAEGGVAVGGRQRRHDVAHSHGRVGGAPPVVAVRHLELVLVGVAEEHGCDGGLVPVHDLVEVVAVVVEGVARAQRHVADDVDAVACVLGRLELRH